METGPYHCKKRSRGTFSLNTLLFSLLKNSSARLFVHLPFKVSELLCVAHDLAKVDVKHVPSVLQHDVVIVAVTDPQDEGGHTPPCTRVDEVHHSLRVHNSRALVRHVRHGSDLIKAFPVVPTLS